MIYKLINTVCNDCACIDSGRLAPRSYFVPFSSRKTADSAPLYKARFISDRVRVLSGKWDFKYTGSVLPEVLDTDKFVFDNIFVPSTWQSEGFEKFKFSDNYQFPCKIKVAEGKKSNNNCGIYRKYFEISDNDKKYILSFIKVGGFFEIYVNGKSAGYSKIAQADFDITEFVTIGQNELVVVVHKFSNASLLDGQANFELTGIAGDVLLYIHDKASVMDYSFSFIRDSGSITAKLGVLLVGSCDNLIVSVERNGEQIFSTSEKFSGDLLNLEFSGDFQMYSAETPVLYDLYLTVTDELGYTLECVKTKIGFRESLLNGNTYNYNGQAIKIKGINYSSEYNALGKLLSDEEYLNDLKLIKQHNINAIKLNVDVDPVFYEMCDELGLYVIKNSSVDLSFARKQKKLKTLFRGKGLDVLAKRIIITQYEIISNKACFTLFSFGKEDRNMITASAIDYLKTETKVPLIYRDNTSVTSCIVPIIHPSVGGLLDEINVLSNKVVFLTEFARSNGIGCAGLKELQEIIETVPCCMGGCISEFSDKYICGEGYDDCGIFTTARKPYSGAENVKYVFRPLRSRLVSSEKLEIFNTDYFADSGDLTMYLYVRQNGKDLSCTQLDANIEPRQSRIYDVTLGHLDGDMYINIVCEYRVTEEVVSIEQLPVSYQMTEFNFGEGKGMSVSEVGDNITIRFDGGVIGISKEIGTIISYKIMGREMLKAEARRNGGNCFNSNIYRPFIRNMKGKADYAVYLQDFCYKKIMTGDKLTSVDVQSETIFKLKGKEAFIVQDMFKIGTNGVIDVFSVITPLRRNLPNIDCFGKQIKLSNTFGNITYYGRGDKDNYIDMYEYAPMGLYKDSIDKVAENYAIAQESGNHTNVHFVTLTDNDSNGIMIMARKNPFHLRVKPYSDAEILRCYKEKCNNYTQSGIYVDINAFVSGIGSTENGMPIAKYLVKPSEYVLQFALVPLYKENSYNALFD